MKELLKKRLYNYWGTSEHPAEWDGKVFGGGRGSQRFWEYLWVIDQLKDSKQLLDIGCGPSEFFPYLVKGCFSEIVACDPLLKSERVESYSWDDFECEFSKASITFHKKTAEEAIANPEGFEVVTCISVLEHIKDHAAICACLSKFTKARIILTLEFGLTPGEERIGFIQWTPETMFRFFSNINHHYISKMEACPVYCVNSPNSYWKPLGIVLEPK